MNRIIAHTATLLVVPTIVFNILGNTAALITFVAILLLQEKTS